MSAMDNSTTESFAGAQTTRFAPSPTGELHLGNARTALFNFLLAHRHGGRFLLRIEDTDAGRSHERHTGALIEDLHWLGLDWDAGPDREDEKGPYRQSERGPIYARSFEELHRRGLTYPCFCTALELEVSRRAQLSVGRPPRYAGTCRELTESQRKSRTTAGQAPSTRFRVPPGRRIEFRDFVHGPQAFSTDDIGDFVVRRADGSAAFFFCNAIDDAAMGVTHVLRGEDHLANTPRQLLILEALGMPAPAYGHVSLLVGADGAPLSKRHGASSVREFRARGFLPQALLNHLLRLGHSGSPHGLLSLMEMVHGFDPTHLGRAPAHFDEQQLLVWQKEAVHQLSCEQALQWLGPVLPTVVDCAALEPFVKAVLPNVVLPEDARPWVEIVFGEPPALDAAAAERVRIAGAAYFSAALAALETNGNDLGAMAGAVRSATGRRGAELYMPLRAALTGRAHGPDLAALLRAMPPEKTRERLARFA